MQSLLIIDDHEPVQQVLALIGQLHGLKTTCAGTVMQATNILATQSFDLCLLDVQLPDGYGIHLIDIIQTQSPSTKIVLISGDQHVLADIAKLHPTVTTVPKPFQASDLLPYLE